MTLMTKSGQVLYNTGHHTFLWWSNVKWWLDKRDTEVGTNDDG